MVSKFGRLLPTLEKPLFYMFFIYKLQALEGFLQASFQLYILYFVFL